MICIELLVEGSIPFKSTNYKIKIMKNKSSLYSISDIHGCYDEFCSLLNKLNLQKNDTLILMGDYVDRGPKSKEVIDKIISLKEQCSVITLKGNHEDMMYQALTTNSDRDVSIWINNGGYQTLASYGKVTELLSLNELPQNLKDHLKFIESLKLYYETDTHIFVHASPGLLTPISEQPEAHLIWRRPQLSDEEFNFTHSSNKTIISGHTAQSSGVPLKLSDKNILIDTGCFFTGVLTAYDVYNDIYITN